MDQSVAAERLRHYPIRCNPFRGRTEASARSESMQERLRVLGDTLPVQVGTVLREPLR